MDISTVFLLLEKHGISMVISAIAIYLTFRFLNEFIANLKKTIDELSQTVMIIKESIVNQYASEELLKFMIKMRASMIMFEYKYKIVMYIYRNNIKENINSIITELDTFVTASIFKTIELFKGKAKHEDIETFALIIQEQLVNSNNIVKEIFVDLATGDNKGYDKNRLLRDIENHITKLESDLKKDIEDIAL